VYCPPFAVTILELYFGLNIVDYFKVIEGEGLRQLPIVSGSRQVDLFNFNISIKDYNKVSGDYSSYDRTIPS